MMNEAMKSRAKKTTAIIRKADENDIPSIQKFIVKLAEFEKLSDQVIATEQNLRENIFGKKPYAEIIIAEIDKRAVGFALFFHNYSAFLGKPGLYIEDLYVNPEYRGEGVGKMLIAHCAKIAKERDCGRLEWSVLKWNPARRLYDKLNAKAMEEWLLYRLSGDTLDALAGD
jgi:GNAT superfamily N-acetyltransferase